MNMRPIEVQVRQLTGEWVSVMRYTPGTESQVRGSSELITALDFVGIPAQRIYCGGLTP